MAEFDAVTLERLRQVGSLKWSRAGELGASVAEMDFGAAPPVTQALQDAVHSSFYGYPPERLVTEMSEACARWQSTQYGWHVDPERVRPVADVIAALQHTLQRFSRDDCAVVVPTPAYMPFLEVPGVLGREVIEVPMVRRDGRWVNDLEGLDRAFAAGGGVLVLCNPHNPLGQVMTRAELAEIEAVVSRHDVRVFADEIHSPLTFDGHRHVPYASLSPATAHHTVTATAASKGWNLAGLKCAQLILTSDADMQVWENSMRLDEHGASVLGMIATTSAYADGGPWLEEVLHYLDRNRRVVASLVEEHTPWVGYQLPEATYLAWLDLREAGLGPRPGEVLRERAGVLVVDGNRCGKAGAGYARLNFATPTPVLIEMVLRVIDVLTDAR